MTQNPRGRQPYPDSEACPCDSGLTYVECCKKKSFRFEIDGRGNVIKSVPLHPQLRAQIEETALRFRSMFGRKPARHDPIVFDHHLLGEEDYWQYTRKIGESAGISEELLFAWRKSGFIVGEHSRDLMSEDEYQEWEDAIDEYFQLKEEGHDPFFCFTYLDGDEYELYKRLVDRLDSIIIVLGFALTEPKRLSSEAEYFRYLLLKRAMRSLRTIREMFQTRYDDDCLAIARSVYEAYLRMKLLRLKPESAERFAAMVSHEIGMFKTKRRKNGRFQHDTCTDPKTGKEYKIIISNREIIEISDAPFEESLYYDLYPLLSGFVHPELIQQTIRSMMAKDAEHPDENDSVLAIILVSTVSILFLLETSHSNFLRKITKRDLLHVSKKTAALLGPLIGAKTLLERKIVPPSIYELFGFRVEVLNTAGEAD